MNNTEAEQEQRAQIDAIKATLVNVPGMGSSPGTIPPPLAEVFAIHQYELGVRVDPALATKKYQPPFRGPRSAYNPAGRYVPLDEEDPEPIAIPKISEYTRQEREGILAQLRELGDIEDPKPEPNLAFVIDG
ncbi:DUF2744 domain-containing protein [Nocardia ninae]|uniref:Uncharacterized protein n=1 Tax=Nocardia ninae NBRC 108245 TaxID=1210091 RepID=A0A511M9P6_9NOCA|nr:DUF2744 domain-containing protein [Nocardia ninae]GEM37384.1 hypothetical protein NN4_19030 [Nocardia ninae NBRC 108245]